MVVGNMIKKNNLMVSIGLLLVTASIALGVTWVTWQRTTNQLSWTMMSDSNSLSREACVGRSCSSILSKLHTTPGS